MDFTKIKMHPDFVGALLLFIVFLSELNPRIEYLNIYPELDLISLINDLFNMVLSGLGVLILLFTRHKGLVKILVVCSSIFALMTLHDAYYDLIAYSSWEGYSIRNFVEGVIMLALGLMLLINVVLYVTKASPNLTMMFMGTIGVLGLTIVQIIDKFRLGLTFDYIAQYYLSSSIPMVLLMIFLLVIMRSDTVKTITMLYNIRESFIDTRRAVVPVGVTIDRSILPNLIEIKTDGLLCDGYEIELGSYYAETYKIVLTKNGDRTSLVFSSTTDDSCISHTRFVLKGVWMDTGNPETCDLVRIYGENGFFIQLIANDHENPDAGKDPKPSESDDAVAA